MAVRGATSVLATAVVFLVVGAISGHPANAGTYVMRNCDVPGHRNAPLHPWEKLDHIVPGTVMEDACVTGGGVSFNLGTDRQVAGGTNLGILLGKPRALRSQISFVKLVLWYAARLTGSGQPMNVTSGQYVGGFYTSMLATGPPGSEHLVAEQELSPDATFYTVHLHCGAVTGTQSPDPCFVDNAMPLMVRGMEVTLSEDVPPSILQPSGSLLDRGRQSGTRSLTYSASDRESGLNKVEVLLGDTVVATRDLTPQCEHSDFTVCPSSREETVPIDTRAVANGAHALTIKVYDAAGNERVIHGEAPIAVANRPSPGPPYQITVNFAGSSRPSLTVPYGRRVSVRGRLTQGNRPMGAGTSVELLERLDRRGAREVLRRRIKTRPNGSFSAAVATTRPSRIVRLAYRPSVGQSVVSRPLALRVRAASRLRASLKGRLIRFSGSVLSGPIPRAGKRVVMEGRAPGSAWTSFKTLRTNSIGAFSGIYRLRVRRPGVVLKVRAVVRNEAGYGYLSSRSKAVALRVR